MNDNTNQLYELISNIQAKLNTENDKENQNENNTAPPQDPKEETKEESKENCNESENIDKNDKNGFDFSNIDINTILKMQSLLSRFSKSSPKKDLLYSLKPFLNKDRQNKLGEYITILSILDAQEIFNKKDSDSNV